MNNYITETYLLWFLFQLRYTYMVYRRGLYIFSTGQTLMSCYAVLQTAGGRNVLLSIQCKPLNQVQNYIFLSVS